MGPFRLPAIPDGARPDPRACAATLRYLPPVPPSGIPLWYPLLYPLQYPPPVSPPVSPLAPHFGIPVAPTGIPVAPSGIQGVLPHDVDEAASSLYALLDMMGTDSAELVQLF